MSDEPTPPDRDRHAAAFAGLVYEWTEVGLMLLGSGPFPAGAEPGVDLDQARQVIDQLEMLQAKTHGNLSNEEATLLKRSLTTLRMAFVAAVEKVPAQSSAPAPAAAASTAVTAGTSRIPAVEPPVTAPPAAEPGESKVRYSKKY
jgi:hypothetical protein